LAPLARAGHNAEEIFYQLAIEDLQATAACSDRFTMKLLAAISSAIAAGPNIKETPLPNLAWPTLRN